MSMSMSRFVAIPVVAFSLVASAAFAQFGGMGGMGGMQLDAPAPAWGWQSWQVKVETVGGKTVSGTLSLVSVPVDCDLGRYHLKLGNVKSIRFTGSPERPLIATQEGIAAPGVVTSQSGEEIDGAILVRNWTVQTDLGQVTLGPGKLKMVTFLKQVETGDEPNPAHRPSPDQPARKR